MGRLGWTRSIILANAALVALTGCGEHAADSTPRVGWVAPRLAPSVHVPLHPALSAPFSRCSNLVVVDIDGDHHPEVFLGDLDGGLTFYSLRKDQFLRVSRDTARTEVVPQPAPPTERGGQGSMLCPLGTADLDGDDVVDLLYAEGETLRVLLRGAQPQALRVQTPGVSLSLALVLEGPPGAPPMLVAGGTGGEEPCASCAVPHSAPPRVAQGPGGAWEIHFPQGSEPGSRLYAWTFIDGALRPFESPSLSPRVPLMIQGGAVRRGADGWDEAVLSADFRAQFALRRGPHGLADVSDAMGVSHYGHGMGNLFGDLDEDGIDDLVVSTLGVMLLRGRPGGTFALDTAASPFAQRERVLGAWGGALQDLDNNGHLDLALSTSGAALERPSRVSLTMLWRLFGGPMGDGYHPVFFGRGGGRFDEHWLPFEAFGPEAGRAFSMVAEDLDEDGRLEVLLAAAHQVSPAGDYLFRPHVLRVEARPEDVGHGLTLRLPPHLGRVGTRASLRCSDGRVISREIYGAEGAGGPWRPVLHFGCGDADRYTALTLQPRDRAPMDLGGGPLDRAIACDESGCVTVPPPGRDPIASR